MLETDVLTRRLGPSPTFELSSRLKARSLVSNVCHVS